MDFRLSDDQLQLQEAARAFARGELPALAEQLERDNAPPPRALIKRYAEMGFLGINVPAELGGLGLGNVEALIVLEEFAKISSAIAFPVFESMVGPVRAIEHFASDTLKRRIVPQVCAGEMIVAAWPVEQRISYPVLIKGWFVKRMGEQPLVYCDVVRVLTPRPYDEYIHDNVRSRRRVSDDESWLYYETLRQLQITSAGIQAGLALADQQQRVEELMREVHEKGTADSTLLQNALRDGTLGDTDPQHNRTFQARLTRLERQLDQRLNRYREYQQQPEKFPMFVDVFQHPDRWQGHLVTLRGHVRRATSHEGDPAMFNGQPLHELWLFTDDSQHNPTVIVTPSLPDEFPRNADVVDSVTVTGCLFKMYVYKSQNENRIAPLLLAGRIEWNPSDDQILALGDGGHLVQGSRLLAAAKANSGRPVSDTMLLLFGFVTLLATMTVWGRVQRDRREHQRLMRLVDERPDFRQTSQDIYSGPFAESRFEPTRG